MNSYAAHPHFMDTTHHHTCPLAPHADTENGPSEWDIPDQEPTVEELEIELITHLDGQCVRGIGYFGPCGYCFEEAEIRQVGIEEVTLRDLALAAHYASENPCTCGATP